LVENHKQNLERRTHLQISAARSIRRSVTRNKNRTPVMMRLRLQMLMPVSARCSWNQADVVKGGRVRGSLQKRGEPLAAVEVALMRVRTKLARVHVTTAECFNEISSVLSWVRE
jgi:hypothetical protein